MRIVEKKYRGSVICRVLGYPISYAIVKMLLEKRSMSFGDIVHAVKRSKSTVCGHLTKLRLAHVIRYEKTVGRRYTGSSTPNTYRTSCMHVSPW